MTFVQKARLRGVKPLTGVQAAPLEASLFAPSRGLAASMVPSPHLLSPPLLDPCCECAHVCVCVCTSALPERAGPASTSYSPHITGIPCTLMAGWVTPGQPGLALYGNGRNSLQRPTGTHSSGTAGWAAAQCAWALRRGRGHPAASPSVAHLTCITSVSQQTEARENL